MISDKTTLCNLVQGALWRRKICAYKRKIVFPVLLSFDDYETNNALGSHAGVAKCGATYIHIPCIPPEYQSELQNIFLFILFNTIDRSVYKNKIVFTKIIEELFFLQKQGIEIQTANGSVRIYFVLAQVLGDNLGQNQILGFTQSFRLFFLVDYALHIEI